MAKMILDLPDQEQRALDGLAAEQDIQVGELLRRAVSLYRYALRSTASGENKLSITAGDGHVVANIDMGHSPAPVEGTVG